MNDTVFEIPDEVVTVMGSKTIVIIWLVLLYTGILVGLIFDVLLLYVVVANKIMRTKMYILIANWAINDVIVLFAAASHSIPAMHFYSFGTWTNLIVTLHIVFIVNCVLAMLLLTSTTLVKSEKVSLKLVFGIFYAFTIAMIVAIVLVFIFYGYIPLSGIILLIGYILLCLVLIVKEINRCCKARKKPVARETRIRLNVVRIYVCNVLFILLVAQLGSFLPISVRPIAFLSVTLTLNSLYIFLYLMKADANFKNCVRTICKRKSKSYNVDAAIRFIDEDSVHEEINGKQV